MTDEIPATPDQRAERVADALRADAPSSIAADAVAQAYDEPATTELPPADAHLFRLRDEAAALAMRAEQPTEVLRTRMGMLEGVRGSAQELARMVQAMDEHLCRGGDLPREWRVDEPLTQPWCPTADVHEVAIRAAFSAGVEHGRWREVRHAGEAWDGAEPINEDHYVMAALRLGPPPDALALPVDDHSGDRWFPEPDEGHSPLAHRHYYGGQVLAHAHPDGLTAHGYYEHPEDTPARCSAQCSEGHTYGFLCQLGPLPTAPRGGIAYEVAEPEKGTESTTVAGPTEGDTFTQELVAGDGPRPPWSRIVLRADEYGTVTMEVER